jgi:integrase
MPVFRQQYKDKAGATHESSNWYIQFRDQSQRVRRLAGFTDRGATEELLRKIKRLAALKMVKDPPTPELFAWLETCPDNIASKLAGWGIIEQRHLPRGKPLIDLSPRQEDKPEISHVADFKQSIIDDDATAMHADILAARVRNIVQGCRFAYPSDIEADKVHAFLAECRRSGLPKRVGRPDRKRPNLRGRTMSHQTSNFYLAAFKQFCAWLVKQKRLIASPVAFLDGVNVDVDRRHDRRNLSADELSRILTAATTGKRHHWMDGPARAMLYRVAMETGLRRAELDSLTPRSIDFAPDLPSINVAAKRTKNRKEVDQPIRRELAEELRRFIEANSIAQDAKLWPRVTKNTANMLKRDLRAAHKAWVNEAGDDQAERSARERSDFLAYVDSSGRFADFHALRHSYISLLTRAGVRPEVAQELARHSDIRLTMQRYSHTIRTDGAEALDALPAFPSSFEAIRPEWEVLAATGTDDAECKTRSVLHSGLHLEAANRRGSVHKRASKAGAAERCGGVNEKSKLPEKNSGFPHSERTSESGEAGIRTLGTLAGTLVFETSTIGHSVTSPG